MMRNMLILAVLVVYRPRFRGHRVDGNRLVRRVSGIFGGYRDSGPLPQDRS